MVALIAGSLLFISNAPKYASNTQFQWKIALILAAAVNMGVFRLTIYRSVHEWDERSPAPLAARSRSDLKVGDNPIDGLQLLTPAYYLV